MVHHCPNHYCTDMSAFYHFTTTVIPPEITQITCLIPSFLKGFHTLGCQSSLIEAYLVQFPHQLLIWHDFGVWSSSRLSVTGSFGFCC